MNGARCYARLMDEAAEDLMARLVEIKEEIQAHQAVVQDLAAERRALVLELRNRHGMSDQKIADALGVHRSAIQAIRAGRAGIRQRERKRNQD